MIVFLDFDGVLHPQTDDSPGHFCCLPVFWKLLREVPSIKVVFSTTWRYSHGFNELVAFVTATAGKDLIHRYIGSTPKIEPTIGVGDYRYRETECLAWLEEHGFKNEPWLALDDVSHWFTDQSPNLHLVDYRTGLTEADISAIIEKIGILGGLES